jgi:hypothetical protein
METKSHVGTFRNVETCVLRCAQICTTYAECVKYAEHNAFLRALNCKQMRKHEKQCKTSVRRPEMRKICATLWTNAENMWNICGPREQNAGNMCGGRKCAKYAQHVRNICGNMWTVGNMREMRICTKYAEQMRHAGNMRKKHIYLTIWLAMLNSCFSHIF